MNGTVAKFEMAIEIGKGESKRFGPPLLTRLPALVFVGFAGALCAMVAVAHLGPSEGKLYEWLVVEDRHRTFPASILAFVVLACAAATVIRAGLRGVVVHEHSIESRDVLAMGIPKIRRWTWAQIHRFVVDGDAVAIESWNGAYERLPRVAEAAKLRALLCGIAASRKIDVTALGDR